MKGAHLQGEVWRPTPPHRGARTENDDEDSDGNHYFLAQSKTSTDTVKSEIIFTSNGSGYTKSVTDYADITNKASEYDLDFDLSINFEDVPSRLYDAYTTAKDNLARYQHKDDSGNYLNPDLVTFYNEEISSLEQQMLNSGEAVEIDGVIEPLTKTVTIASLAPITASAGYILVRGDRLEGSGEFDSPKDVTLEIVSNASAFLEIQGVVVPDTSGAVIFGSISTDDGASSAGTNALIRDINSGAGAFDNNFGDANDYSGLDNVPTITYDDSDVAFTYSDDTFSTSAPLPLVLIEVNHDAVLNTLTREGGGSFDLQVWPAIYITGDVQNLRGDVVIDNNSQVSVDRNGLTAIATIRDQTVGDVSGMTSDNVTKTNDTITVTDVVVGEADGYAVFTVSVAAGTSVQMDLDNGSATEGTSSADGADFSSSLETSTDGTNWSSYTDDSDIDIGSNGYIQVRTAIFTDSNTDDAETFSLVVSLSDGSAVRLDKFDENGSSLGDIKIADGVSVNARNIYQRTGGTLYIGGPNSDLIYHINGDEYAKWRTNDLTGSGTQYGGTENANDNGGVADYLAEEPTVSAIEAARIYIDVASLNINGIIKSGEDNFSVILNSSTKSEIDSLRSSSTSAITKLTTSNNDYQIYYDPSGGSGNGAVLVTPLNTEGGYVDLTGKIYNTHNGKIIVNAGLPYISVDNQMGYAASTAPEIIVYDLDATTAASGKLIIKDEERGSQDDPYVTIYQPDANGDIVRSVDNSGFLALGGRTDTYSPAAGKRYGWTIAQDSTETTYYEETKNSWLGIGWLVPDHTALPQIGEPVVEAGRLLEGSDYFRDGDDSAYTYNEVTEELSSQYWQSKYETRSTWYGKKSTTVGYTDVRGYTTYNSHTIEADRDIDIEFIGNSVGTVLIDGENSDIVVNGAISNATGDTTISTTGSIGTSSTGTIGGKVISLSGNTGIGSSLEYVALDLEGEQSGAYITATASGGEPLAHGDGMRGGGSSSGSESASLSSSASEMGRMRFERRLFD